MSNQTNKLHERLAREKTKLQADTAAVELYESLHADLPEPKLCFALNSPLADVNLSWDVETWKDMFPIWDALSEWIVPQYLTYESGNRHKVGTEQLAGTSGAELFPLTISVDGFGISVKFYLQTGDSIIWVSVRIKNYHDVAYCYNAANDRRHKFESRMESKIIPDKVIRYAAGSPESHGNNLILWYADTCSHPSEITFYTT